MNDIEVSSIDLVEGGNVFKQGHYLTLGYVPRDEKGETVDLSGKTLNVSLWGRKGVVFEAAATYSAGVIRFTLDKMVPAGDYTVEFTVTSSTDAKYRKKFPTNQHSGRIAIKQSADDLGVVGIQVYTVAQLKAEQKALLDAAVSGFTVDSETKMARVSGTTTHPTIGARLEADKQETAMQLSEKAAKDEARLKAVKLELEDASPTLQAAIAGGGTTPINLLTIPQKGSVTPEKTTYTKVGKNKFNQAKLIPGGYYGTNGTYYPSSGYSYGELIPASTGEVFRFSKTLDDANRTRATQVVNYVTAYDSQGNAVEAAGARNVNTYTVPASITHILISSTSTHFLTEFQVEIGSTITPFAKYEIIIENLDTAVTNSKITDNEIKPTKLDIPNATLPDVLKFERGTVNYDANKKITLVSSSTQTRSALMFAKAGSKINKVGNLATYFNVSLIELIGGVEYFVSGKNNNVEPFEVLADTYYRVVQIYNDLRPVEATVDLPLFNKEIFTSHGNKNSVVLKGEIATERSIVLPPYIPCVVGKEIHVYLDNILRYGNYYKAERFDVRGKGDIIEGGFEYLPATGAANETITFDYYAGKNVVLSKSTALRPVPTTAGSGVTKKIMVIGESTTDNPDLPGELHQLFSSDVMNIEMLGTRGTAPALHEGRGGWRTDNYLSSQTYGSTNDTNAFYNPTTQTFDFSYYMAQQGYASVDYVCINLGINDADAGRTAAQVIANYEIMIASIRAFDPNIKIFIGLTNLPAKFENRGLRYMKDRLLGIIDGLIAYYGNREAEGYYLAPIYTNLDPYWDFPYVERAISARNPKKTFIGTNTVHPSNIGYFKAADMHYNVFKYVASLG